jgi:hypothetical protein
MWTNRLHTECRGGDDDGCVTETPKDLDGSGEPEEEEIEMSKMRRGLRR